MALHGDFQGLCCYVPSATMLLYERFLDLLGVTFLLQKDAYDGYQSRH